MQLSTAVAGGTSAASLAAAPMAILRQAMSQGPAALFIGEYPPPPSDALLLFIGDEKSHPSRCTLLHGHDQRGWAMLNGRHCDVCPRPCMHAGTLPRVLKRTGQTALVWTLYEELVPGLTAAYVGAAAMMTAHGSGGVRS